MGVLCLVSVTCSSKGKTARKDLLINFMVVTLLIEGGVLVFVAISLGEKKDAGHLLAPSVGWPC